MAVVQIQTRTSEQVNGCALFRLGFRPFFLSAAIFAMLSIASWMGVYTFTITLPIRNILPSQWHAHEMLYGYGMAVVAGFLLTAVKNWTGIQTPHGRSLLVLFVLWVIARVLFLFGTLFLVGAAVADLLFGLLLTLAVARPVIQSRQWKQLAVVSKLLLLWVGNLLFYLGCYHLIDDGLFYAINGAVWLFIGLILMIGRRVIPFFIERGVAHLVTAKIELRQHQWVDVSIMVLFIGLFMNAVFIHLAGVSSLLAAMLFVLNGYRLFHWHTSALWRVPLLWSLYISAWLITLGFLCVGLQAPLAIPTVLTMHLFTIGGIGLMTIAMMSRVALGHTGRDIRQTSPWLKLAFAAIIASAVFRIILPLAAMQYYQDWLLVSALCWIMGFAVFLLIYAPVLCKPRVDGMYG